MTVPGLSRMHSAASPHSGTGDRGVALIDDVAGAGVVNLHSEYAAGNAAVGLIGDGAAGGVVIPSAELDAGDVRPGDGTVINEGAGGGDLVLTQVNTGITHDRRGSGSGGVDEVAARVEVHTIPADLLARGGDQAIVGDRAGRCKINRGAPAGVGPGDRGTGQIVDVTRDTTEDLQAKPGPRDAAAAQVGDCATIGVGADFANLHAGTHCPVDPTGVDDGAGGADGALSQIHAGSGLDRPAGVVDHLAAARQADAVNPGLSGRCTDGAEVGHGAGIQDIHGGAGHRVGRRDRTHRIIEDVAGRDAGIEYLDAVSVAGDDASTLIGDGGGADV